MENLLNLLDKRPKVTEKPGAKALKVTKGERPGTGEDLEDRARGGEGDRKHRVTLTVALSGEKKYLRCPAALTGCFCDDLLL